METTRLEMQKKARIMATVCEVLRITAIVALCIFVVSVGYIALAPGGLKIGSATLHSGLLLNGKPLETSADVLPVLPEIIFHLAGGVMLLVVFILARRMFLHISRESTPFTMVNVQLLRRMGVATMVSSLLPGVLRAITAILLGQSAADVLDMLPLVIGLILFLLASIFTYGVRLQQENDETV